VVDYRITLLWRKKQNKNPTTKTNKQTNNQTNKKTRRETI